MIEEIVARALIIAGVDGEDALMRICCEDAAEYVKAYCHREALGQELCGITAQLAAAAYIRGNEYGAVSIQEGDRQISYGAISAAEGFNKSLEPFVRRSGRVPSEVVHNV